MQTAPLPALREPVEVFALSLPRTDAARRPLYYRVEAGRFSPEDGRCGPGTVLTLDTYFNLLPCGKLAGWTVASAAVLELRVEGACRAQLLALRTADGPDGAPLAAAKNDGGARTLRLGVPLDAARLAYLRLEAGPGGCRLLGGRLLAEGAGRRPARVAGVVCTYRREGYVRANMRALYDALLAPADSPVGGALELFVVDNGQTLVPGDLPQDGRIHLLPNKNCGGSGGFTRGLMEALARRDRFTHVLFMDDDIRLDPGVVARTVQLAGLLRPELADTFLAGGMLRMEQPAFQVEAGAGWACAARPRHGGLDLRGRGALLANDREEAIDYAAWWYVCLPLTAADNGLPLPFFIKQDDVEFSLRSLRHCLTLNGVGVWHEGFEGKYNTILDYYFTRNDLVTNAVHRCRGRGRAFWAYTLKCMLRGAACGRPEAARYAELALEHFLQGPDFFLQTDMERLNASLRAMGAGPCPFEGGFADKVRRVLRKAGTPAFWAALGRHARLTARYLRGRRAAEAQYRARWRELTTEACWRRLLDLPPNGPPH